MSKISNAKHADVQPISHRSLPSRFGSAFVAGCLALSVCPAIAFAAPGGQDAMIDNGMNGNAPAAMQVEGEFPSAPQPGQLPEGMTGQTPGMQNAQDFAFQGMPDQAPAMQGDGNRPQGASDQSPVTQAEMPESMHQDQARNAQDSDAQLPNNPPDSNSDLPQGQMPNGQPGQAPENNQLRNDDFDKQVRDILSDKYGIGLPSPEGQEGNGAASQIGDPANAPELPEGAVNVQQVIDTSRDVLDKYRGEDLSAKLNDAEFAAALKAFALSSNEQRLAMFASSERPNMENPSDLPSPDAQDQAGNTGEAPAKLVDGTILQSVMNLVMETFGYIAS